MKDLIAIRTFSAAGWRAAVVAVTIFAAAPGLQAQDAREMTVTGSVDAAVDGTERQWLTISGEVDGKFMHSAAWQPSPLPENPMAAMMEGLPEGQRAEMQAQMEAMAERMGADSPAAQMFGGGASDQVRLRITAVDPGSDRILRDGMLTIEVPPFSAADLGALTGTMRPAEISLFKNFGEQTGMHVSSHDLGTDAAVGFDRLEIAPGGGAAEGHFEASLCPLQVVMQIDGDEGDCILVVGRFATELGEEAP